MGTPSLQSTYDAVQQAYAQFEQEMVVLRTKQLHLIEQLQKDIDAHRITQLHQQLQSTDE